MMLFLPTSTSVRIEVAMRFSGNKGLMIEMNNNGGKGKYLRGFDVSWLSLFKEEDER